MFPNLCVDIQPSVAQDSVVPHVLLLQE